MKTSILTVLSDNELEILHEATIRLMENPGVKISSKDMREQMFAAGCSKSDIADRIRIPERVVTEKLSCVPSSFEVCGLEPSETIQIGGGETYCASGFFATFMLEPDTRSREPLTVESIRQFIILAEALDSVDMQAVPGLPQDVNQRQAFAVSLSEMLKYTRKPLIIAPFVLKDVDVVDSLLRSVFPTGSAVSRWICQQSIRSPLTLPPDMAEVMLRVIPAGVPMLLHSAPQTALSAPFTLSGLLLQYNVEIVTALVVAQIIRPGAPCLYGGGWGTSDLHQLQRHLGSPEAALLRIAGCQMAREYSVPYHCLAPDSDSFLSDQQASWEKLLTSLSGIAAGSDIIINSGMLGTGMHLSLIQLYIDAELIRIAKRFCRGIDFDTARLAEDVIREASVSGDYLAHPHTFKYMRSDERHRSSVTRTQTFADWCKGGKKSIEEYASKMVADILDIKPEPVLPRALLKELDAAVAKWE